MEENAGANGGGNISAEGGAERREGEERVGRIVLRAGGAGRRFVLGEDAVVDEEAENAAKSACVSISGLRELGGGARALSEKVGDAKFGGDVNGVGDEEGGGEAEHYELRGCFGRGGW